MPKNTSDLLYYAIQSFYTVSDCAEMHEIMMLMRKAAQEFDVGAAMRENRSSRFPTSSDTNRAVQAQKMTRDWKFWI